MLAKVFQTIFAKILACFFSMSKKMKLRNKHLTHLFLYCIEKEENKTIRKCDQKEPLVFHDQLNWYIFNTFHNKNGRHIHLFDGYFL